jgi:hypothetical protein
VALFDGEVIEIYMGGTGEEDMKSKETEARM